jgi:hypothetical protein
MMLQVPDLFKQIAFRNNQFLQILEKVQLERFSDMITIDPQDPEILEPIQRERVHPVDNLKKFQLFGKAQIG